MSRILNNLEINSIFLKTLQKEIKENKDKLYINRLNEELVCLIVKMKKWPSQIKFEGQTHYKTNQFCHNLRDGRIGVFYETLERKIAYYTDGTIEEN